MNAKTVVILLAGVTVVGLALRSRSRRAEEVLPPPRTETATTPRVSRPRLPAPRMPARPAECEAAVEAPPVANAFTRLLKNEGEPPKPSREQVESYLARNGRSADSLLTAFRLTGDRSFLEEAAARYPREPRVSLAGWVAARTKPDASPEERRRWLEAFQRAAPDNALANYLRAQDYFKSGQTDRAVEELIAATGKAKFQDYSAEGFQSQEEAYLAAGSPAAEAKAAAAYEVSLPHLSELRRLADSLRDLAAVYRQAGDESSAQAALQMGLGLGQRLEDSAGGSLLTHNLVGLAIERGLLGTLDANLPYGNPGQTVQNQLEAVNQRLAATKGLWKETEPFLQTMSDQDLISYFDRMKSFGELEALRWVQARQAKP